jgi:hypothetical protein
MIAVLEPLHAKLEEVIALARGILMILILLLSQGPQTARETSFAQVFGRELAEAREVCRRYRIHGETSELDKAWDIYYTVRPCNLSACCPLTRGTGFQEDREATPAARHIRLAIRFTSAFVNQKSQISSSRQVNLRNVESYPYYSLIRNLSKWTRRRYHRKLRPETLCYRFKTAPSSLLIERQ